jgi:UrcA family protein
MCAALTASTLLGATAVARAEDAQMRVNMAGLDLGTGPGATAVLARIRYQAAKFCGSAEGRMGLDRTLLADQCRATMVRRAVEQLGSARVTALYKRRPYVQPAFNLAEK